MSTSTSTTTARSIGWSCNRTRMLLMAYFFLVSLLLSSLSTTCCHGFTAPSAFPSIFLQKTKNIDYKITSPSIVRSGDTALFGIPKMFRWLTDQYPNILNNQLSEGLTEDADVDNFYLDMNGIIHPCTHGNSDGKIVILDETAMFKKIFLYVDKLYKLVRPNHLLYLAVDGVAPRAKMNQQRSRRFRSAKEAEQLASDLIAQEQFLGKKGQTDLSNKFDSNCITPGTDFMLKLSLALQKWVQYKMETDPFWMNGADVILSGPDVPGEGEHKVMDFIREMQAKYDSGQKSHLYGKGYTHVLYGLDADLIMLGLVTHEPNFMLLREKMAVVMAGRGRNRNRKKKDMMDYNRNDFELLELKSLRQLLSIQFREFSQKLNSKNEKFSLDRIIDDFVFMCMLVGNDFLPHAPHMEIDGGAISLMTNTYIDLLSEWGGYMTNKEKIHPDRFEQFLYHLALYEQEHFKRRGLEEYDPGWKLTSMNEGEVDDFYGPYYTKHPVPECAKAANKKGSIPPPPSPKAGTDDYNMTYVEANVPDRKVRIAFKKRYPGNPSRSYRDYYYLSKMGWCSVSDRERTLFLRRAHVRDYLEGLHWVLNYYHNGCPSWNWYFPHLYAPLITDMVYLSEFYEDFDNEDNKSEFKTFPFELGEPFPSLAQLLSVLPPQSADLLPKPLSELMFHPSSPLIEYYPSEFSSDPNGKRQSWEAVVQIPFIDADSLLGTVNQILKKDADAKAASSAAATKNNNDDNGEQSSSLLPQPLLTPAERRRNMGGKTHVFRAPGRINSKINGAGGNVAGTTTTKTRKKRSVPKTGVKKRSPKTGSTKSKTAKSSSVKGSTTSKMKTEKSSTTSTTKTKKKKSKKVKKSRILSEPVSSAKSTGE